MEELFKSGKMDRCNFLKPCKTVSKDFHKTAASFLLLLFANINVLFMMSRKKWNLNRSF